MSALAQTDDESTPLTGGDPMTEEGTPGKDRSTGGWSKTAVTVAVAVTLLVVGAVVLPQRSHVVPWQDGTPLNDIATAMDNDDDWIPAVGDYSLPISYESTKRGDGLSIQQFFDNGLMHCFGFAEVQAQRLANLALQKLPPASSEDACPMCYWLLAMAHAPYLNHPRLSADTLGVARQAALQAKQGADHTSLKLTAKEIGLIDAMSARFAASLDNQIQGYEAYRDHLVALHATMPDDLDIMAFLADAIMILHCDSEGYHFYQDDNVTPLPDIVLATKLLETCLQTVTTNTDGSNHVHPLCAHLYIHVTEPSDLNAHRANDAADRLAARYDHPAQTQHLQHMPSHTYLRVGRYHDAMVANLRAHTADEAWLQHGQMPYGPAHDTAFLIHAAGLAGERNLAYRYANVLRKHYRSYPNQPDGPGPEEGWHIWRTIHLRFGDWDAVLQDTDGDDLPLGEEEWPYAVLLGHFAKGVAVLGSQGAAGLPEAQMYWNKLQESFEKVQQKGSYTKLAKVANWTLASGVAYAAHDYETALSYIHSARLEQESWTYSEPPTWFMTEAACEATLLRVMGRPQDAMTMFQHDLDRIAENRYSLYGLWQAQKAAGLPRHDVAVVYSRYEAASIWADNEDPPIVCPQFLAQPSKRRLTWTASIFPREAISSVSSSSGRVVTQPAQQFVSVPPLGGTRFSAAYASTDKDHVPNAGVAWLHVYVLFLLGCSMAWLLYLLLPRNYKAALWKQHRVRLSSLRQSQQHAPYRDDPRTVASGTSDAETTTTASPQRVSSVFVSQRGRRQPFSMAHTDADVEQHVTPNKAPNNNSASPVHPQIRDTAADAVWRECYRRLQDKGVKLTAHGVQCPSKRIWLQYAGAELLWQTEFPRQIPPSQKTIWVRGAVHRIPVSDVLYVDVGKTTAALVQAGPTVAPTMCFSLLTAAGSLDLQAASQLERNAVVAALSYILDTVHLAQNNDNTIRQWRSLYAESSVSASSSSVGNPTANYRRAAGGDSAPTAPSSIAGGPAVSNIASDLFFPTTPSFKDI